MKTVFTDRPSTRGIVLFGLLWVVGVTLSLLAMTDLFSESPFQKRYIMMWFILLGSFVAFGRVLYSYIKGMKK